MNNGPDGNHPTTTGVFPAVGDVYSTTSGGDSNGHTGVVASVTITNSAAGDATITIDQQNSWSGHTNAPYWPTGHIVITNWSYAAAAEDGGGSLNNVEILHFNGSGNTTPTNHIDSNHAEYVIGSDHHVYTYLYQPSTNWTKQDISGTTAALQGNVASYLINGCHFAFAIDTSGDLQEYYRCSLSSSWTHSDLSNTLGVTFTGSPQGYAFTDPSTNAVHHSLNLVGTDGNFYNVFYTPATNWQKTLVSSAATFTGTPSGYAFITSSSYLELVYLVASNGSLYEFIHTSSGWASQNVFSSLAPGVTAINSPSAYSYIDSSGNTDHSVFVLGSNHHLYNLVYRPATNWKTYDISGAAITY